MPATRPMARISITFGNPRNECIAAFAARKHRAHRNDAIGDPLGRRDEIGRDAEIVGGEWCAKPAEPSNHLIENQQDAVLVAERTQALEIALRRDQHAGRAGDRLHDHGRNRFRTVQRDQTRSTSSANSAPCAGWPLLKALRARSWVWLI